jgi:plasmid stabilization system protein ParE
MPIFELTDRARDDLLRIADYIGEQNHRRSTAKKTIQGIKATCQQYARHPFMGQFAPELGADLRLGIHQRWVIIYEPHDKGIRVLRIVDGARDYSQLFSNV